MTDRCVYSLASLVLCTGALRLTLLALTSTIVLPGIGIAHSRCVGYLMLQCAVPVQKKDMAQLDPCSLEVLSG